MDDSALILYLEDNPRDAELVRDKLQQTPSLACELRVAGNRAEYEAALAEARFDLILSDYALPDYDGMAALALARERQPDVPFILIYGTAPLLSLGRSPHSQPGGLHAGHRHHHHGSLHQRPDA